jgi:acetate kinase
MGFKCVMGITNGANLLTPEILAEMEKFGFVAPAHNLPYLEAISEFKKVIDIPMVGVFEPSFHYSVPDYRRCLGLPRKWEALGVNKLGFHGASHRYLSASAYKLLRSDKGRVITVHLGGSSSICAVKDGESVDIDQHFSPNSGLLQGTRVGDADVTAVLFAMKHLDISIDQAQEELSYNSGLKGVADIGTEDFRSIRKEANNGNKRAKMALQLYIDGVKKHIGASATVLGGVDCIVFGGGIGENDPQIREQCLENMEFMGIFINKSSNRQVQGKTALISDESHSEVKVYVVPTNEELVVGYFTKKVVQKGRDLAPHEMNFIL